MLKISEVEKITGLTAKAIRLYEEKGLISVSRKDNLYRDYDKDVIDKLMLIKSLRDIGVSLSQICLHFNDVITFEELLNIRKTEMEKENIFHQENYNKCIDFIRRLQIKNIEPNEATGVISYSNILLGLDIGSTNISAVIVDYAAGKVLETYVVPNTSKTASESDFAEFDVDWISGKAKRIVDYLIKVYPNIKGIGITGQMHGMVYISADGKAVSPLYSWQDGRGNRKFSESKTYCEEIFDRTGYICSSGYAFSTLFYNRVNHIEPKEAKSFCSIMDYVVMILTHNKTPLIHVSTAASFGLYDIKNNCFDLGAVEKLGLLNYTLPQITELSDIAGYYKSIPICVAIGDNQASFFGGVKEEKTSALVNFGTGSQVSVVTDKLLKTDKKLEIRPYLFGKYLICGSALCGGKAYAILESFFSEYAEALTQKRDLQYEIMNKLAQNTYSSSQPLFVSTLFCGTRQDPSLRGLISGIDDVNFTPGNLILGVLHGMAYELKTYFDCMNCNNVTHLVASGNAVKKNPVLARVLKDTFKMEVILTDSNEEAAIGSALYAGVSVSAIQLSQAKEFIKEGGGKSEQR